MMPCTRPACPDWLEAQWETWGQEYADKLVQEPRYRFSWKQYEGEKVNHRLMPLLREMTADHCAYCDWFPTDVGTDRTIDHFRPKALFPREVYYWPNLYLCCRMCQEKDDANYSEDLIRPDEIDYDFDRFFIYNYLSGKLDANPDAGERDRSRASLTIKHFKLNEGGRPAARKRELKRFRKLPAEDRHEFLSVSPFRFVLIDELED